MPIKICFNDKKNIVFIPNASLVSQNGRGQLVWSRPRVCFDCQLFSVWKGNIDTDRVVRFHGCHLQAVRRIETSCLKESGMFRNIIIWCNCCSATLGQYSKFTLLLKYLILELMILVSWFFSGRGCFSIKDINMGKTSSKGEKFWEKIILFNLTERTSTLSRASAASPFERLLCRNFRGVG